MDLTLNHFPCHATDKIRYADTDRQGHVNNARFATYLETGRVEVLYHPDDPLVADDAEFVIARLTLNFEGEIQWPGSVSIGTGIEEIGTSSVTISQAIFQDDQCVARAETVIVQVDTASRSAQPLDDTARGRLQALQLDVGTVE
ncbi:thioesterase [Longibacter salinarum]|uniref:Thioesterase n=1 Tax=Longibacter salinarum TaxID=1850348 RepID=A0A2A8CZU0_9BACT|nr:thioesterase family protein [Longibacter salinarum]PEN14154.1 thioesterase [Longibacter salinarum]